MSDRQAQRQTSHSGNVETRQANANARTIARSSAYKDASHGGYYGGYYGGHWDSGGAAAAGFVAGATVGAVAASAAHPTTVVVNPTPVVALPCAPTIVSAGGVVYQRCGSTYYTESYSGGSVVYVQTAPPPGY